jgi:hypothetical protein
MGPTPLAALKLFLSLGPSDDSPKNSASAELWGRRGFMRGTHTQLSLFS